MRVLVVSPGPDFSVADVHRGWVAGLRAQGCEVVEFDLGRRLDFYATVGVKRKNRWRPALERDAAIRLAAKGIEAECYRFWPDVVVVVSCFFIPPDVLEVIRAHRHKVVIVHTESPYEDDGQVLRAPYADLNVLNDPTNLERFQAVAPTTYIPHAYDPAVHYRRPHREDLASDFCFVGTGFPSRIEFLEAVDWTGVDVALAGQWLRLADDSPLRKFVAHDIDMCIDNADAMSLYSSAKCSANLYRKEAERPELETGWAMGPREVELAATGTPFLRQSRGEGDELFPMLPIFDGPDDFTDKLNWWLARDDERIEAGLAAQAAVSDRTFANNAKTLLALLEAQPSTR